MCSKKVKPAGSYQGDSSLTIYSPHNGRIRIWVTRGWRSLYIIYAYRGVIEKLLLSSFGPAAYTISVSIHLVNVKVLCSNTFRRETMTSPGLQK